MTKISDQHFPINGPPGISPDFLIEPGYIESLGWTLYCFQDRPTFRQIAVVIGAERENGKHLLACYDAGSLKKVVPLNRDVKIISSFLAEMVGGNVCIYDLPNSFLMSVLEGDITILATSTEKVRKFSGSSMMDERAWFEIAANLRKDLKKRILEKYTNL